MKTETQWIVKKSAKYVSETRLKDYGLTKDSDYDLIPWKERDSEIQVITKELAEFKAMMIATGFYVEDPYSDFDRMCLVVDEKVGVIERVITHHPVDDMAIGSRENTVTVDTVILELP
jgi:hypothetical protein